MRISMHATELLWVRFVKEMLPLGESIYFNLMGNSYLLLYFQSRTSDLKSGVVCQMLCNDQVSK